MPHILLLGTCDTKLEELLYAREQILSHKYTDVTLVDVGRTPVSDPAITVSPTDLTTKYAPDGAPSDISKLDRGELNKHMAACATNYVRGFLERQEETASSELRGSNSPVSGILSLGGSGGTSLAAAVMREALPMGFPKLIVSTIASGETGPIIGETDITLMYSIVDIAGLNTILRTVLSNAAGAIFGMASAYQQQPSPDKQAAAKSRNSASAAANAPRSKDKDGKIPIRLGITMFGVTTPAVTAIRSYLSTLSSQPASQCPYTFPDTHIFHATGHGGLAYERLVTTHRLDAAIDLTTTELVDFHIPGAVMSAGPTRLTAAAATGVPQVVSLGATDMANFGARGTVPEKYVKAGRKLFEHNPSITLMRTSAEECGEIGRDLAGRLRDGKGRCEVWVPRGGVSLMSVGGGPFEDKEADEALFKAVREGLEGSGVGVVEDERDVNDEGFARGVVDALVRLLGE